MTRLAERKGELLTMMPDGRGRVRLDYRIPARGLIGFRTEYLTATAGTGLLYHVFDGYAPRASGDDRPAHQRRAGVDGRRQGARLRAVQPAGARLRSSSVTASRSTKA